VRPRLEANLETADGFEAADEGIAYLDRLDPSSEMARYWETTKGGELHGMERFNVGAFMNTCNKPALILSGFLVETLEALGTKARPLAVRVEVLNAAYIAAVEELGRPFRDLAEAKEWQRSRGVYSYGFGTTESPGRWPGHLVVVIRQRALLDLTIAQADDHEHGIALEPIFGEVSGRFLMGLEPAVFLNNGCQVRYLSRPADRSYEETPNWLNR
jgi:hypothetical protein